MKSKFVRIIALVLVLVMTLQMAPVTRITARAEEVSDAADSSDTAISEITEELTVLGEVESLRSEDTKHFRMSDGSFTAVSYGMPVHYQDEDGTWQDINNVPVMAMSAAGDGIYRIVNAESAAAFAATLEEGQLLTVSYEDMSVSMQLLDPAQALAMTGQAQMSASSADFEAPSFNRNAVAQLEDNDASVMTLSAETDTQENALADDFMPDNLRSSILYENVYPGVDIRYTAWSYNIKEEIIVRTLQDSYSYDFYLALKDLFPVENADGSISLTDSEDREIYRIPAPYMIDAAGAVSELVTYDMTLVEGGLVLTVEADESWIESSDRELPVVIDPSVSTSELDVNHSASDDIYSTYIHPAYPNHASANYGEFMYTGYNGSYPTMPYISYLYFNDIPKVPAGCVVANAKLRMFYCGHSNSACSAFPIGVYPVTIPDLAEEEIFDWFKSINYNSKPEHDTERVIDFLNMTPGGVQNFITWDITELAKGWYEEESNLNSRMIALAPAEPFDSSSHAWQYYSADGAYYVPTMIVNYRSTYGLEDYYTYQTMGAGEAGTAYITDSTGQLKAVKNLASFSSDASPFSLNLVYNSDYFMNSDEDYLPPTEMGLNMSIGSGWTLDCIQTVVKETLGNDLYLVHRDGDGTVHYYGRPYSQANTFYDEDGLNLSLTFHTDTSFRQEDRLNNYKIFREGVLTDIADWDRNMIYINYTDERITSITRQNKGCTEVTLATFAYNGNLLTSVTDSANNVYALGYTDGNLTSIQKNGTTVAQYSYSGYQLTKMTDSDSGYSLNFEYTGDKISNYNETALNENAQTVSGAAVSVTYPGQGQTVYRDMGMDGVAGSPDDLLYTYLTDYAGRTINTYVTNSSPGDDRSIYGASNAAYSTSGNTNNRILRSASIGVAAQNLLRNNSFESTSSETWTCGNCFVAAAGARTGANSLTGNTNANTYATHASESLTAGKTYTFSGYVNTQGMTFSGNGIYLKVTDSANNSWTSDYLKYATDTNINGGWTRISVTFPAKNSGAHTLSIHREGAAGTFYADDFQLEEGEAPSAYNMVENGSMLSGYKWNVISGVTIGSGVLSATGKATRTDPVAYQDIPVNMPGTSTFVLSGWGKADTAPDTVNTASNPAQDTNKQFGLRAVLTYSDGATEYHYVPFDTDVTVWQFASLAIVPGSPEKTISTIRIVCAFEQNIGSASFDNISLTQETVQSMDYDENGMLKSVKTSDLGADVDTYSEYELLIKKETAGSGTYRYKYDDMRNRYRVSSVSNNIVTESYDFSDIGNQISTTLSGTSGKKITTSSAYNATGDLLTSVTDAAGNTVSYAYNNANSQMLGMPTSVTTPDGTVTDTNYDSRNRVAQKGIAWVVNLEYNYNKGNLTGVTRANSGGLTQTYNLGYDAFGNMTSVKVGNRTLGTYAYANNTGLLTSQTYGNGDTVSYTYDNLGRVKTTEYSDGLTVNYAYNGEGNLYSVTSQEDGVTTKYINTHDSYDRPIYSEKQVNGTTTFQVSHEYDSNSRLTVATWHFPQMTSTPQNANTYSNRYGYNADTGLIGGMVSGIMGTSYTYDDLLRLTRIDSEIDVADREYTYRDINTTQTTNQVTKLNYPNLYGGFAFDYTYDSMGNIATYVAPGEAQMTYTYDQQGQLLSASNGTTTYSYTYDTTGNILNANGHTYTYGNAEWRDLLTAYDGQSITYDNIGNPTEYYNGTNWNFTWENGRRLASASGGGHNISYTYDLDGLRTSKTVDGVVYNYYYAGDQLVRMTYGNNILDFYYNAHGTPILLNCNGNLFYYITNLQGDVIRLVDIYGQIAAMYQYDPYGNVIQALGSHSQINPLRYRGYYYDTESGMYYLQSRYYDPKICRFINADAFVSTGQGFLGYNMFAYCRNNPVNKRDLLGYISYDAYDEDPNGDRNPLNDVAKIGTGSISRGTFRTRLVKLTGQIPPNSDAHHIFPYSMATKFSQLGIDVNNAQYGSWVDSSTHRQYSYDYNQWWIAFFEMPDVTRDDAFALVEFLAVLFGFDLNY